MKRLCSEFYLAWMLVLVCPLIASALVVDDFRDGALELTLSRSVSTSSQTVLVDSLDPAHTVGGERLVYGSTGDTANLQIAPNPGFFQFDASVSWGYFRLSYGSADNPLDVNLRADGSNAFLLTFPEVTPGLWRGSYDFSLTSPTGVRTYGLESQLFALNGPGAIRIPFSYFDNLDLTHVSSMTLDAVRVEPTFRIRIGSIVTIPEPASWLSVMLALSTWFLTRRR